MKKSIPQFAKTQAQLEQTLMEAYRLRLTICSRAWLDNWTSKEIADALGMRADAVRQVLCRARREFSRVTGESQPS
jgi:DNA-directed RNA polymerase specialized sigma24 family protein